MRKRPRPPITPDHCRHFGFSDEDRIMPTCAVGMDNTRIGGELACTPRPVIACPRREELTDDERRAASEAFLESIGLGRGKP